jgi:membrane protein
MSYVQAFTNILGLILPILVSIVFFKEFSARKDFKLFHSTMIAVSCIFISYGIFEYILQFNPILFFLKNYIEIEGSSLVIFLTDENNIRFGSIRCQSLFMHSISYGTYCVLFILYYLYVIKECHLNFILKLLTIILIPILFFCMITSGARSPIIGLLIGLTAFFNIHTLKRSLGLYLGILCIIFLLYQLGAFNIFLSLISSLTDTKGDEVSGSSIDLRLLQLKTCFIAISSNPIIGLGARGGEYAYNTLQLYDLAGLESCWFHTLINQGLLGCCALIYIYYSLYRYTKKECTNYSFETSIVLCFLIINTMTSIPEVGIEKLLFIFIVMTNYKKEHNKLRQLQQEF